MCANIGKMNRVLIIALLLCSGSVSAYDSDWADSAQLDFIRLCGVPVVVIASQTSGDSTMFQWDMAMDVYNGHAENPQFYEDTLKRTIPDKTSFIYDISEDTIKRIFGLPCPSGPI